MKIQKISIVFMLLLSGCAAILPTESTYGDEYLIKNTAKELYVEPSQIKLIERSPGEMGDNIVRYKIQVSKGKSSKKYRCEAEVKMVAYWWSRERPTCKKI